MAKFGEKTLDFKDVLKSCRIPVSCAKDQWFLNAGKNSVVNVRDQKTLHTWTLTHPHCFTCSVVHSEGNLYCVMDRNVLLKWSSEEDSLKNAENFKFQESIFDIIPLDGAQPLILFDSGKIVVIGSIFSNTEPLDFKFLQENEKVIWADACISGDAVRVFCLALNQKNQNKPLYHFTIDRENFTVSNAVSNKIFRENAVLKSWCLNPHVLSFLSLWSDGVVCSHSAEESKNVVLLSMKDIETENIFGIDSIDSTHIAVARGYPKQQECALEIWDFKCAVLKARKVLKTPGINTLQIYATNSNMFLCFNKELVSLIFHVEDTTFYAALGMSESNQFVQHSWNTELELLQVTSNEEPEAMDVCSTFQDSMQLILEKLAKKDSSDLMCLTESDLVKLLQFAVKHKSRESNDKKVLEKDLCTLLNIVFSTSFNDILLVKYLKKMNLEDTLSALQMLLLYLNQVCMPSDELKKPSHLQILNWTCLIVQSHTEALLFSKDKTSRKLLKQLEAATSVMEGEYEDFSSYHSYICVTEKDISPQKSSDGKCCIETIDI